jgi:NADH-quinone oxidoreductase subunit J
LQIGALLVISRVAPVTGRPPVNGSVESIGRLLFTDYLFPFELTSVLLLAAMVGVLLLARRRA